MPQIVTAERGRGMWRSAVEVGALAFALQTERSALGPVGLFLAAWLAAWVLRTEDRPGPIFALASLMAMAGVIVLALVRT